MLQYMDILSRYIASTNNCHHRSSVASHTIWTTRQVDKYLTGAYSDEEMWIYDSLVAGLDDYSKRLAIAGALFHDIGKCDGRYSTLIKPQHPEEGFVNIERITDAYINNRPYADLQDPDNCYHLLHLFCLNVSNGDIQTYTRYMAIFALISRYHQSLGDVMKSKDTLGAIRSFVFNVNRDYIGFGIGDVELDVFHVLLLIALSDVKGAWRVTREDIENSLAPELLYSKYYGTNNFLQCPRPQRGLYEPMRRRTLACIRL